MQYLIEEETTESVAAADPFEGRGLFLPAAENGLEILARLEREFGRIVPAAIVSGNGAWLDATDLSSADRVIASRWQENAKRD